MTTTTTTTLTADATALHARLTTLQKTHPLSILNLAEPLLEATTNTSQINPQTIAHDFSTSTASNNNAATAPEPNAAALTPSSLTLDLQHYRDLFSKLRFSYLEQVTKEKYLRSIVGDPPLLVTPKDNAALEAKLKVMKEELQAKKAETDALVVALEDAARALAVKYESGRAGIEVVGTLPTKVEQLQREVEALREEVAQKQNALAGTSDSATSSPSNAVNPRYLQSTDATRAALADQTQRISQIDKEIADLERRLPSKIRECERAERELEDLDRRKEEVTRQAKEVQRIREEGGRDFVGERGRWLRAQEGVLKGVLGVEA
ncbi:Kinetochore protein Sos7 [Cyphellophora attinorum]|uniref:Kinetochore protein Sos7 n=1 Tax=Cyphellophora attinorum TaxID=1664694 RepID=A0A0N1NXF7_9EURO|nr:Kinetochore protein Sos7 [Phialophora attinorum]KPI35412.1 Kinetochore protein Sos7 [Phialophora attinorum]